MSLKAVDILAKKRFWKLWSNLYYVWQLRFDSPWLVKKCIEIKYDNEHLLRLQQIVGMAMNFQQQNESDYT